MALKLKVVEVNIDNITKGKNRYSVASVVHTYNGGENRTQKIMSFANPQVFERVKTLKAGDDILVDVEKNEAGYNQWVKLERAHDEQDTSGVKPPKPEVGGRVTGSNYETKEERAARQVLIVKQSAIKAAVDSIGPGAPIDDYFARAQGFADWVFDHDVALIDMQSDDLP